MTITQNGKCTPEEKEILNILLEESSEVVQAISKIFRFGWNSCHPDKPNYTNKAHLTEELGDLICMVRLLMLKGIIDLTEIKQAANNKLGKLRKYSDIDLTEINYIYL